MSNKDLDISTLPAAVQVTVNSHIHMLEAALPGLLGSYYIVGSVALRAFIARRSDIDFVAILNRRLTGEDLIHLEKIHRQMGNKHLFTGLDGFYITESDLLNAANISPACVRFNEGRFRGSQPFDTNSIDAWVLKQYGICIKGQGTDTLAYTVDWDRLLESLAANVNTYWRKWAEDCKDPFSTRFLGLYLQRELVDWGVLGISRIYYTLLERDVASKTAAGHYMLETIPEKWHRIILEAIHIRNEDMAPAQYKSIVQRRNDAIGYMAYMIGEISRLSDGASPIKQC